MNMYVIYTLTPDGLKNMTFIQIDFENVKYK